MGSAGTAGVAGDGEILAAIGAHEPWVRSVQAPTRLPQRWISDAAGPVCAELPYRFQSKSSIRLGPISAGAVSGLRYFVGNRFDFRYEHHSGVIARMSEHPRRSLALCRHIGTNPVSVSALAILRQLRILLRSLQEKVRAIPDPKIRIWAARRPTAPQTPVCTFIASKLNTSSET